jgi:ATP-dependent DNA helicase RecG
LDPLPGAHAIIQPLNENYSFDAELTNGVGGQEGGQKGGQNEDSETTQKTAQKTTQKTTQKILDAISNNPNVTRLELSEICGITADGVKWQLRNLTKSGRIARIGGDRGGHWEVHDK